MLSSPVMQNTGICSRSKSQDKSGVTTAESGETAVGRREATSQTSDEKMGEWREISLWTTAEQSEFLWLSYRRDQNQSQQEGSLCKGIIGQQRFIVFYAVVWLFKQPVVEQSCTKIVQSSTKNVNNLHKQSSSQSELSHGYHAGEEKPCFHITQRSEVKHNMRLHPVSKAFLVNLSTKIQVRMSTQLFLNYLPINSHLPCNGWGDYRTLKQNWNTPPRFMTFGTAT